MLSTAIIVFREILEISLILSVIMVATKGMASRNLWVMAGLGFGVLASLVVAFFADQISGLFAGSGQEIFNAAILFAAVAVLAWTVIWMKTHGREIVQHMKKVSSKVVEGTLPLYSITIVIALSTLREGSEIVLFVYGIIASQKETLTQIFLGGMAGLLVGTIVGVLLYFGMIRISPKHLFSVTSWLLTFLAAGMAAQGAGYLIAADVVPALIDPIWNSSEILPENGLIGRILHSLIGYTDRPSAMQAIFYSVVFAGIAVTLICIDKKAKPKSH